MHFKKVLAAAFAALAFPLSCFAGARIEINLPAHTLSLYENGVRTHSYPVAIGKYSTPTPTGEFSIIDMGEDPVWTDPETMESVESGDWNPLGYRWIGFYGRYGIHGNNNPSSIGLSVSNGCVRMYEEDVEQLYDIVDVGTPVDIVYERVRVEKDANNQVALYIYPDCYDEQDVDVETVESCLKEYGVNSFLSADAIASAIDDSDGEAIWIAGVTPLLVDMKELPEPMVTYEGVDYFPMLAIAKAVGVEVKWNGSVFISSFSQIPGVEKKGVAYATDWQAVEKLLGMKVRIDKTGSYHILPADKALLYERLADLAKEGTWGSQKPGKSNVGRMSESDFVIAVDNGAAHGNGKIAKQEKPGLGKAK